MLAIKGLFDGTDIKPLEPIPFKNRSEVIITFLSEEPSVAHKKNWRHLRGIAKGENILESLLKERNPAK